MDLKKKSVQLGFILLGILILSGALLLYKGNDAIALAIKNKEGILTAEQVKVSFDSVGGRMINEAVKEADQVKKGDILMVLDSTDVDLAIAKLKTQIAQMDAQINSLNGTIRIGYAQTDTDEQQSYRQIDQQRAALDSARASYKNKQLDYERKASLVAAGAISRSEMDDAQETISIAKANVIQQEQLLAKMLAGVEDNGETDFLQLPLIDQQRQTLANKQNDVQNLIQQKKALEVELAQLKINKERLTLRAPEDGKILSILAKQGEMIAANTPVILLESKRYYYDIYLNEKQASQLAEGDTIVGKTIAGNKNVQGTIRFITAAPGFADLKMSREKGQTDLSAFQVRIYAELQKGLLPGMTVEVMEDAFTKR